MTTSPHPNPTGENVSRLTPRIRIAILTSAVALTAAVLLLVVPGATRVDVGHLPVTLAVTVAFALSERLIFHIEARREAVSYTPTEIGVAIGLLFLSPLELVVARLAGAVAGMLIWRRPPLFKLLFNMAHFALESLVAVLVFGVLGGRHDALLLTWLGLLAGLLVALIAGGVLVATAISQFEGELRTRIRRELVTAPFFHMPTALVAAMIAVSMTVEPQLGAIAFTLAPVVWFMIRAHGALMHRHRDLTSVHDFSRIVNNANDLREIATAAAERLSTIGRAGRVALRLWSKDGEPVDVFVGETIDSVRLPDDAADPMWLAAFEDATPRRFGVDGLDETGPIANANLGPGIVAGIADPRGPLGVVILAERQGASPAFDDDDVSRLGAMVQQLSIVVRKAQFHSQIQHEAAHDRLTDLPNRSYFEAWTAEAAAVSERQAVLMIDLDRFKEINDVFGHHAGDTVLAETAERIRAACRPGDLASRFGGDEFAVLASDVGPTEAALLAEVISAALEEPYDIGGATVAIGASVGIAVAPDHTSGVESLLRCADLAMYAAKSRRTRAVVYSDDLEEGDATRLTLLADLRVALKQQVLELHFQPQIDLTSSRVIGAEALARWRHPEHGFVSPDLFIGLAEQSGLIEELTKQVLVKATAAAAQWQRRGWDLSVSVNVSAQSLLDERLVTMVEAALAETGLDPGRLMLEITETTMMGDAPRTHRILQRLADLGIGLSVDDFGTGFSSLANLRHFPLTELKIDRKFIIDLARDLHDDVIVRSTIELGHNLGLTVVAEGVEDEAVQNHLLGLGCDIGQGYGISRPVAHQAFLHWVNDRLAAQQSPPRPDTVVRRRSADGLPEARKEPAVQAERPRTGTQCTSG